MEMGVRVVNIHGVHVQTEERRKGGWEKKMTFGLEIVTDI